MWQHLPLRLHLRTNEERESRLGDGAGGRNWKCWLIHRAGPLSQEMCPARKRRPQTSPTPQESQTLWPWPPLLCLLPQHPTRIFWLHSYSGQEERWGVVKKVGAEVRLSGFASPLYHWLDLWFGGNYVHLLGKGMSVSVYISFHMCKMKIRAPTHSVVVPLC